jgi:hypothetical protein
LVTISEKIGNSWVVQAVHRRIEASSSRKASIIGARIVIETRDVGMHATNGRNTSIYGAIAEVVAINGDIEWNKVASSSVITEIVGASIVVIAEGVLALSS